MLNKNKKFFGTVDECDFRGNIQSTETYTDDATLHSGSVAERIFRKINPERSITSICICLYTLDFFSEITLGHGPMAHFRSYWHMPFFNLNS